MAVRRVISPGFFRMLLGTRPYGSDPAWNSHVPPTPRVTGTTGVVQTASRWQNARMTFLDHVSSPRIGAITVADNDFSTGLAELVLGEYRLLAQLDFAIGALPANTATNVAAAISALPGWTATAALDVVEVTRELGPADEVDFQALHHGTKVNFTLVPSTGTLGGGNPVIGSPLLT